MKITLKGTKAALARHFTRKLTTLDVVVDPHDTVGIQRTLDKTLLEYTNVFCDTKFWRLHPMLVFLQAFQLVQLYLCCGLTEKLKMPWSSKRWLVAAALPLWYALDLLKQAFVLPEKHWIIKNKRVRLQGRLSRTHGTFAAVLNGDELFSVSIGDVFTRRGVFLVENFEQYAMLTGKAI